jgi:hypothetical protein
MLDRRKQFLVLSELVTEDSVGLGKEEQNRGCKPPVTVGLKTLFQKSGPGWEGNEKASFDDVQVIRIMSRENSIQSLTIFRRLDARKNGNAQCRPNEPATLRRLESRISRSFRIGLQGHSRATTSKLSGAPSGLNASLIGLG